MRDYFDLKNLPVLENYGRTLQVSSFDRKADNGDFGQYLYQDADGAMGLFDETGKVFGLPTPQKKRPSSFTLTAVRLLNILCRSWDFSPAVCRNYPESAIALRTGATTMRRIPVQATALFLSPIQKG